MEEEKAELEDDMPICDHVDDQDNLEGPRPGQSPVVFTAITITGRNNDGDVVCNSVNPREKCRRDYMDCRHGHPH